MKSLNPHHLNPNVQPQSLTTPYKPNLRLQNARTLIRTPQSVNTSQDLQKLIKYRSKNSKIILHLDQGQVSYSKNITKALLQNSKVSVSLALASNSSSDPPSLNLYHSLSNLKYLQNAINFNLPVIIYPNDRPRRTKFLSHTLTTLKRLTRISLKISDSLRDNEIHSIFRSLYRLPSLSHLALRFSSQGPSLQLLASCISKLSHLKGLTLHFLDSPNITQEELTRLSPIFLKLSLLSEVDIKLGNAEGSTAQTITTFLDSVATLKYLIKLHLSIAEDIYYRNPWRTNSLSLNLKKLNTASLRELFLEFDEAFTDPTFASLSWSLTRFSSLQTLSIDFSKSIYITESSISQLVTDLEQLSKLTCLTLAFSHFYQNMIKAFSQNLSSLTGLTDLTLNFKGCLQESIESVKVLSSSFEKLKGLRSLALIFHNNKTMNDQTLELLMKGIEKLEGLKSFEIDLSGRLKVGNKGIKAIASSLSHLQNLSDLKLSLETYYPESLSLKAVASILKPLHSLHSFELKGYGIACFPEGNDVDFFLSVAQDLKSLQKINLIFEWRVPFEIKVGPLKHQKCITVSIINN